MCTRNLQADQNANVSSSQFGERVESVHREEENSESSLEPVLDQETEAAKLRRQVVLRLTFQFLFIKWNKVA